MTLKFDLKLNILDLEADHALEQASRKLGREIRAGFDRPDYAWPGVTKRRSGEVVGSPRDVVDLGTLRDSQTEPVRVTSRHYRIAWTAEYAAATFLGAVFRRRRYVLPARNVPLNVLREFDFPAAFAQAWKG